MRVERAVVVAGEGHLPQRHLGVLQQTAQRVLHRLLDGLLILASEDNYLKPGDVSNLC